MLKEGVTFLNKEIRRKTRKDFDNVFVNVFSNKKFSNKKASYFFTIDAFVAGAILVLTMTLILSFFSSQKPVTQINSYINDYVQFINENSVRDFQSVKVRKMVSSGLIVNPRISLAKQIIYFYYMNLTDTCPNPDSIPDYCLTQAEVLINETIQTLPSDIGFRLKINSGSANYSFIETNTDIEDKASSKLTYSLVDYLFIDSKNFYGPVTLGVEMWT